MNEEEYNTFMINNNWYNKNFDKYCIYINKKDFLTYMETHIITLNGSIFCKHNEEKTIYYDIINELMVLRKKYKKLQFDNENKDVGLFKKFRNKQASIKVVMNSIYGVMGSEFFRFAHQDLVEAVTFSGKEMIKMAGLEAENWILNKLDTPSNMNRNDKFRMEWIAENQRMDTKYCLYTDTDSIMLELNDLVEHNLSYDKLQQLNNNIEEKKTYFINYILDKIVPNLQAIVNDNAMNDIIEYHNGDIINEQHYKFKQEWVAKRAFFLTVKKQYALYLVASEGNLVDKTDYKGLEVERSDYPSLTKQYLDEILKYILKTEEVDFNYIKEFKLEKEQYIKRLILEGNPIVAKPASWSKKLENYKVVPSQVHAMILWNKTMYEYFNSGSKGYLFDISGLVFENFKNMTDSTIQEINQMVLKQKNSVCIPREVDKLPDGFVVNVNSMLEFAWNTRISRITDSLFRNVKSDIEESILKF
jgi:DNA polymerase I